MVGASYGGGIQLVTAAIDKRVDAIVPTIAWHSLNTSLYKAEAFKTSWGTLLTAALTLTFARANPRILPAAINGLLTGTVSLADQKLLDDRGPDELVDKITAPTLLIQGTVDTLFTLQEAHENAMALIGNGVPTKVVWYCGGHGACISSTNDGEVIQRATLQWLDRYVKGNLGADGPAVRVGRPARATVLVQYLSGGAGSGARRLDRRRRCASAHSGPRRVGPAAQGVRGRASSRGCSGCCPARRQPMR